MTDVRIDRLGHHGDGIADGPIYVAKTLPGEVVSGEISGDRIAAPRIITPSSYRVKSPCRHYNVCGGCALLHASDAFVGEWKKSVVLTALENQGISAEITALHTSPEKSRRRAVLHGTRTKKGATVGLNARASEVLHDIPDCILISTAIMEKLEVLRALTIRGGSRRGRLTLTVTEAENGIDVSVVGGLDLTMELRTELAAIAQESGLIRLTWADEVLYQSTAPYQQFGAARVIPPAGSFLQATSQGESSLVGAMKRAVGGASAVVDLFAGCGTFSLPLASDARVHAVEGVSDMMDALELGWRGATGLKQVSVETRDLFRRPLLPAELKQFDAVVIDPPRAGAEAQTQEVARSSINTVGFVSCNPVTFAREAKTLIDAGFTLDWLEVVDQFRWSPHVEMAAKFSRM